MESLPDIQDVNLRCQYWQEKANYWKHEFDEYSENSRQLELELELALKQKDEQLKDLRIKLNNQQQDIEKLRIKIIKLENENSSIELKYAIEKNEKDELKKYTRELEQKNDDLERAHRVVSESVAGFEAMLNREYEKNVLLEVEYEMEKEHSQVQLQRLMDEARDLKQELKVRERQPTAVNNNIDDIAISVETQTASLISDGVGSETQSLSGAKKINTIGANNSVKLVPERIRNGNTLAISTRSTALNIVADLLQRVNQLDKKLSCKKCERYFCNCINNDDDDGHPSSIIQSATTPTASVPINVVRKDGNTTESQTFFGPSFMKRFSLKNMDAKLQQLKKSHRRSADDELTIQITGHQSLPQQPSSTLVTAASQQSQSSQNYK